MTDAHTRELERRYKESGSYEDCKAYGVALQRSGITTLEVTDGHPEDLLGHFWPNVTYKHINCIELIFFLDGLGPDAQGDYDYRQECFLGWIPDRDLIVIGWDAERTDHHSCNRSCEEDCDEQDEDIFLGLARLYKTQPPEHNKDEKNLSRFYMDCHRQMSVPGGFYPAALRALQKDYPTMIGLRYD